MISVAHPQAGELTALMDVARACALAALCLCWRFLFCQRMHCARAVPNAEMAKNSDQKIEVYVPDINHIGAA